MSNHCVGASGSQERFTFAQIPLVMARDPILEPVDIPVTMFILPWMRGQLYGWATLDRIADGADVSRSTVQRSLKRLHKARWFAIEPSKINPSRREFTALWMTDEGFEALASRLRITSDSPQLPQLVYSPNLARWSRVTTYEEASNAVFTLHPFPEVASMDSVEQDGGARSSSDETALSSTDPAPDPVEDARNAAAMERGVRGLYHSRVPRGVLGGSVACLARLAGYRLDDRHSHAFHCGVLWRIIDGNLDPEVYLKALATAATEPRTQEGEEIQRRGARFKAMIDAMEVRRTDAEFADEWSDQHGLAV